MSDISPIGRSQAPALTPANRPAQADLPAATQTRPSDRVEFSTASRLLSRLGDLPDVRLDLVNKVRGQIADGSYETSDKLDTAIENLAQDLGG